MQGAAASYKSELLSESDEDDRERKRLRTDNTAASRCVRVETIVQRLCRCQRQTCCTQFQSSSGVQTIERVRATVAALANHEKKRFLQDALRVKPNFQSEIYSGEQADGELMESEAESERGSLLESSFGSEGDASLLGSGSEGDANLSECGSDSGDLLSSLSQDEHPPAATAKRNYKQRTTET